MAAPGGVLTSPSPRAGAVLCGGASRRMGTDKALLEVDGVAMVVRVARTLEAAGIAPVVAVGGNAEAIEAVGVDAVADAWPHTGPLGGIITAMDVTDTPIVLVLACDLLAPSTETVEGLVDALDTEIGADIAVPVLDGERQFDQLAIRRQRSRDVLASAFAGGVRSIRGALGSLVVVDVREADPASLRDADTPSDVRLR